VKGGENLGSKIFGIGLINAFSLFIFFMLLSIGVKIILAKTPVSGLNEIVHAA
jgi:hypothetical protein